MIDPARLFGFAFANADFLFEIDRNGNVVFAVGATRDFLRDPKGDITGKPAASLFQPSEGVKFATLTRALGGGGRAGPYKFKLATGSDVQLCLFRLPENKGHVSCTLAKPGARAIAAGTTDRETGLKDRDGFLSAVAELEPGNDELSLVDVPALKEMSAKLSPGASATLMARIGENMRKLGSKTVGRLSDSSFGIISQAAHGQNQLGHTIRKALVEGGIDPGIVRETLVSLKDGELTADQRMLALRYVVERFAANADHMPHDLHDAFDSMMDATQERAMALTRTVADGSFSLVYQPIADLKTRQISHYEALARFSEGANTAEIIGFAEALGIADAIDLAVAVKVLSYLEDPKNSGMNVAFNISGRTILSSAAFGLLSGLLARHKKLAPRLLIEITETAEINDLAAADRAIQLLRQQGLRVGLDDFGSGAASLQYLQSFTVDFLKIDGALVRKLGESQRDDVLLRGMVNLCDELGVLTIAESIEDEIICKRARDAGFLLGQGMFLGKPAGTLPPPAQPQVRARRQGVRESWG